jgi:hypothetical protein
LICSSAGVEAIRAGIMKGTLLDGFPSASSTGPKRSASSSVERLRVNGRDLPRMCHQQLAEAILLSTRSSMKQASNS